MLYIFNLVTELYMHSVTVTTFLTECKEMYMILDSNAFNNKALRDFWGTNGKSTKGLPASDVKRIKAVLVHLDTARSLNDIAEGLGKAKNFHKLSGYANRYAMSVTGNDRVVFDCEDSSTGIVTNIDYEDYH